MYRSDGKDSFSAGRALVIQGRVIGALIMRELHTRYGRDNVGYLWMILEPMMLAVAVSAIHIGQGLHFGGDVRPVPFAIIGYGIFIIFRGIFTRAEGTLESNRPLLYHRMVTILDMLVARAILEGAAVGMTVIILLAMAVVLEMATLPPRPLLVLLAMFYMIWISATNDNKLVARLIHPGTYLLMPIAGGFFMLGWIPEPFRSILWYVPFVHIFELARYGQFEACKPDYFDLTYLTGWCLSLTVIGMLSIRIVRRHVHLS
jgi:capsular polysaccharide transport system permease protein